MRILHCTANLESASGGPARSVPQLATALAELGHEVGLWSPQVGPEVLPDCPSTCRVRRFSGALADTVAEFGRPDLVHDHGLWLSCHHRVAKLCCRQQIPRVVSPRGMLEPWALGHKRWKKRVAWWLYQRRDVRLAKCLHATAEAEMRHLRRLGLNQPGVVIANGIAFPSGLETAPPVGGLNGMRHALFLGRVHPQKGLDVLIDAWSQVHPAGWVMHVVGPGDPAYHNKLRQKAQRAGLSSNWSFEEAAEGAAKWQWMIEADLFILPSFSENFGIVVAEALTSATPVITTTATPWSGLHAHDCGWWVEPTVRGVAAALQEATALSPARLSEMGRRGAAWARKEFAWPPLARKMAELYHWVCRGGEPPSLLSFSS